MPACPTRDQLADLLNERLDDSTAQDALDGHLAACHACRDRLEELSTDPELLALRGTTADSLTEPSVQFLARLSQLHNTTQHNGGSVFRSAPAAAALPNVPGYEVLEEIGRGGMGVVYRARHLQLGRPVALKMLRDGALASRSEHARFRSEAEAVARLQHPNIVQIFEVGEHDGRPFLALEYVGGGSLSQRLAGQPQSPRQTAELVATLARAAHYAHQQGVIHRDLKPANILLTSSPASPDGLGVPKIVDFGLAKQLTGRDGPTTTGDILGTPSYMAPEQARTGVPIGPAVDVYALGTILYAGLTGRPPFQSQNHLDTLFQVVHHEPVPPSRLNATVPLDLATISVKCLAKNPAQRYGTAAELADDLERFLAGRPILARPAGAWERFAKWAGRHPAVAFLSALVALVTLLGVGLVAWKWREAEANAQAEAEARRDAQQLAADEAKARREVERLLATADVDRALSVCTQGNVAQGLLWLAANLETAERLEDADLEQVIRLNLAAWQMQLFAPSHRWPHGDWAWDVCFSPDGRLAATACKDGTAKVWSVATGLMAFAPLQHDFPVWSVGFSPDGKTLMTGCGAQDGSQGEVRFWDAATGKTQERKLAVGAGVFTAAFSKDGRRVLVRTGRQAQLWDLQAAPPTVRELTHPGCRTAGFSPDGLRVVTGGMDRKARVWDVATGALIGAPLDHAGPVVTAAFDPQGKTIAAGCWLKPLEGSKFPGGEVRLWDATLQREHGKPLAHRGGLKALAFSPDGRTLLAAGMALADEKVNHLYGEARLWDVASGRLLGPPLEHPETIWSVAFSPDGRTCATGGEDRSARVWLSANGLPLTPPLQLGGNVRALAFGPDGRTLLTGSATHNSDARLWTVPTTPALGPPLLLPEKTALSALSADARTLLACVPDQPLQLVDVASGKFNAGELPKCPPAAQSLALRSDGRLLALGMFHGDVQFVDLANGKPAGPALSGFGDLIYHARFSPDGKTLLTLSWGSRGARRWQVDPGKWLENDLSHLKATAADWSADGKLIATSGVDRAKVWDASTGKLVQEIQVEDESAGPVAFHPDGRRLLLGSNRTARLWNASTGKAVGPPLPHPEPVVAVSFSPDGRIMATASGDRSARLWDVRTGKPLGAPLPHRQAISWLRFLPDGRRLAAMAVGSGLQTWELPQPWTGPGSRIRLELEVQLGMELDETRAVQKLSAEALAQRRRQLRP